LTRRELFATPLAARAAQVRPDLGEFHPFLEEISASQQRPLGFLDRRWSKLEPWKKQARAEFLRLLSYDPPPLPLSAKVEGVEERDGFRIETLTITATAAHSIPAKLLIPAGGSGARRPGVIAIHCHSGRYVWGHEKILTSSTDSEDLLEFRKTVYGNPPAEELVRRGFVVLVIDGFYFGKRRLEVEKMNPAEAPPAFRERLRELAGIGRRTPQWNTAVNRLCSEFEQLTAKTIFSTGATWPGILNWDDRRSVDYLVTRPEVDPRRIGCIGLSIGGLRSAYLAASDPRLKAACVTGWMTVFHSQLRNHLRSHTWMVYVPGMYAQLDLPDAAALLAPGALMVQQCKKDALFPLRGMEEAVEKLAKCYAKAGMGERFSGKFYDVPHSFVAEMQADAYAWLQKWL
jgi:dienelactone hydrolase